MNASPASPTHQAIPAATVLATRPPATWLAGVARVAEVTGQPAEHIAGELAAAARAFTRDPATFTGDQISRIGEVRARLQAEHDDPTFRWANAAARIDHRLPAQPDWPITAHLLQQVHDAGIDTPALLSDRGQRRFGAQPAQELLRYRLLAHLPTDTLAQSHHEPHTPTTTAGRSRPEPSTHESTTPTRGTAGPATLTLSPHLGLPARSGWRVTRPSRS